MNRADFILWKNKDKLQWHQQNKKKSSKVRKEGPVIVEQDDAELSLSSNECGEFTESSKGLTQANCG